MVSSDDSQILFLNFQIKIQFCNQTNDAHVAMFYNLGEIQLALDIFRVDPSLFDKSG